MVQRETPIMLAAPGRAPLASPAAGFSSTAAGELVTHYIYRGRS